MNNKNLKELIKSKGIGKSMSKSLQNNDFQCIENILQNNNPNDEIGLATLFTALLMLPRTPIEENFFQKLQNKKNLPKQLTAIIHQDQNLLPDYLYCLLQHQNLNKKQIHDGLNDLITSSFPAPLKAAFLEGLRLKEESPLENQESLIFFYRNTKRISIEQNLLIDFANPYDGFKRFDPVQLFTSLVLASNHLPCIFHGNENQGPKFGITIQKLLKAAQKKHTYSLKEAKSDLENPLKNWAYLEQNTFNKDLHQLLSLRTAMVKRPLLATIEKFLSPVIAKKNLLITGYTHPAYRHKSIQLLQALPHHPDFILIRGQEGSSQAPLDRRSPCISFNANNNIEEGFVKAEDFELTSEKSIKSKEINIDFILDEGQKFLNNKTSKLGSAILYQCHIILKKCGYSISESQALIQDSLKNKKALSLWQTL